MSAVAQQTESSLRIERQLAAQPQDVFDAWTTPASLSQWMCPVPGMTCPVAEMDVRVGGKYRIVMAGPENEYEHTGEYRVVDPPNRLSFTWISMGTQGLESVVTVDLASSEGGTLLTLTHDGLPSPESVENHRGGWSNILETLAGQL